MTIYERVAGGIIGLAIGDALGVPVEFRSRRQLQNNPVRLKFFIGFVNSTVAILLANFFTVIPVLCRTGFAVTCQLPLDHRSGILTSSFLPA